MTQRLQNMSLPQYLLNLIFIHPLHLNLFYHTQLVTSFVQS